MNFIDAFVVPEVEGIIYFPGRPRQYRADCKAGAFKIGESNFVGSELKLEILSFRTFETEMFDYPYQPWLEIIFVDPNNVASHILFKTESLDNFFNLLLDLTTSKEAIGAGITTAKMSKRNNEEGGYYAVEFGWQPNEDERVVELAQFANSNQLYAARFQAHNPNLLPQVEE